jgi:hypothetical protein
MAQTTLDDDDLFSEAASEMREDVESSLAQTREALPNSEAFFDIEAENTLALLNRLSSRLETGAAAEHLHDAKKTLVIGREADAFDDADDLASEIEGLEELLGDVEAAQQQAEELSSTVPELKAALEE